MTSITIRLNNIWRWCDGLMIPTILVDNTQTAPPLQWWPSSRGNDTCSRCLMTPILDVPWHPSRMYFDGDELKTGCILPAGWADLLDISSPFDVFFCRCCNRSRLDLFIFWCFKYRLHDYPDDNCRSFEMLDSFLLEYITKRQELFSGLCWCSHYNVVNTRPFGPLWCYSVI